MPSLLSVNLEFGLHLPLVTKLSGSYTGIKAHIGQLLGQRFPHYVVHTCMGSHKRKLCQSEILQEMQGTLGQDSEGRLCRKYLQKESRAKGANKKPRSTPGLRTVEIHHHPRLEGQRQETVLPEPGKIWSLE